MTKEIEVKQVVISTLKRRGQGVSGDPVRVVTTIHDMEGKQIAEHDPCIQYSEKYAGILQMVL